MIYVFSRNNKKGIDYQKLEENPKHNTTKTICSYCFENGHVKITCRMLKTWKLVLC